MGRVETVDASGVAFKGRGLDTQDSLKAMKETQFALKWLGRSSPDRNGVEAIAVNPPQQQSQKADVSHRARNSNSIVKPREILSARTQAQQTSREQLPESGHTGGSISAQNPTKNEDDAFELFKKEFVAKLAEKVKERPGYSVLANQNFTKPVKAQEQLPKESKGDVVKPVKENSKLSNQGDLDSGKPAQAQAQAKLFNRTESLNRPTAFVGPPNLKTSILEETVKVIESSRTILRSSSLEKKSLEKKTSKSPVHEKSSSPSWMAKHEKFNLDADKQQPWSSSKDIEETSKEFILNKFFQTPPRRTPSDSVYDVFGTDGELETPRAFSARRRVVPTEQNAVQTMKDVRQAKLPRDEKQTLGQMMTEESDNCREAQGSNLGENALDRGAQIRREMSKTSLGSPGRRSSSEDRRKDLSGSPGKGLSFEDRRKDLSGSPGSRLSSEDRRKDLSGSPGRGLAFEDKRKDLSGSPGRGLSSEDRRKDLSASPGRGLSSEDRRKDLSGSPGRGLSFEDRRKDLSGSPGRGLSSEDRRKDLSGSPGRGLSFEERRKVFCGSPGRGSPEERNKDSPRSPGRKLSSLEKRKDSSQFSSRSIGGAFAAEDLRARNHEATVVLNETQIQANQSELLGRLPKPGLKGNRSPDKELQQESLIIREQDSMLLKSVKKAAAVDQAHFLRALQDNGTVQSSSPISSEDIGYSSPTLQRPSSPNRRPSSPNRTKNSDNLREARGSIRVDVPLRDFLSEARETQNREPSPTGRREPSSFGSSTRHREPSPIGRREEASNGSSGSTTNAGRMPSPRRSQRTDSPSEKSSSGSSTREIYRTGSGERSQLPSGCNSPSCSSPRLSRQSSFRSTEGDENESVSGGSIIERLMKKASLRKSSSFQDNQTISTSVPASPNHRSAPQPPSSDSRSLRRTLSFADLNTDTSSSRQQPDPPREIKTSSPRPVGNQRKSSSESNSSEDLPRLPNERKSFVSRVTSALEQSAGPAPAEQHPLSNSLRVNVQVKESTIAKLKSRFERSESPVTPNSQKLASVQTVEESYRQIVTPERTLPSVTSGGGSPWSPGSDDSGSEASGIELPSPVSVLSCNEKRTPFQEDSRLSPLEHKIQVLHERIRKSKIDVTNQKKARLQKIKATEAELNLCVVTELKTDELVGDEVSEKIVPPLVKAPQLLSIPVSRIKEEKKKPRANVIAITRDEKLRKARPAGPVLDFCTSLETLDITSISPWAEGKKWDLVYIRDVLLVSNFGRDRSTMTRWHSVTEPMDPCLYDKLEEFYELGKRFSGSQFLCSSARSTEGAGGPPLSMQEHVQRVFLNPATRHRAAVDSMNRCHLFDAVNETLAKKLVPYVALPRPWMKPLAKLVVRPRPTGSALMQEIWADIHDQIGNNGSMSMDKAQLHQSLEDLISEDLFKRSDLFPCRDLERNAERVGIELERRILDDLLLETISSLNFFDM